MFWIQLITSVIGTLGFAMLFKVRPKYLAVVSVLGGICHAIYWLFSVELSSDSFVAALISTVAVAALSELLARIARCPAIVFLLAGVIPIVPGGFLYKMMKELIEKDLANAFVYGSEALKISLGVAGGIVVISVIISIMRGISSRINKKTNYHNEKEYLQ